ncbi:SMYD5 protein, partial [Polypterus senegalus]
MAAPVGDVFRCCVDPAKTSQTVEVRLIDNVKLVSIACAPWRQLRRMHEGSVEIHVSLFRIQNYAEFEENFMIPVRSVRNMHYPPETASIMLMAKMVATVKQARDKVLWQNLFSQFCSRTANEEEEIAHKLLGEKFQWFTPEGFRSLFALVGTNGQGIGTSSLSQWVHACDALELQSQQREQLDSFIDQLYKDIEKGNHSCIPNAEASFPENNFLLHLTALSDIKQGECVSQADDADVTSEEDEEGDGDAETEGDDLEDEMTDV